MRAYDPVSGTTAWQGQSPLEAFTGETTTASGLLFFGGLHSLHAADAQTGKVLWSFRMGQTSISPAVTYAIEKKQYVAIAAGNDFFVFGLP